MDEHSLYERYSRQIALKQFGGTGQQKLLLSGVLVIGAGGLGCPALQYLTAAGIGKIGIADDDTVSLSNLQRQVLYRTEDIGKPKAAVAAFHLRNLNPTISFQTFGRIDNKNALSILKDFDIVIDATDNFSSRYLINDACVLLNKPLIYGAVSKFEGQLAVFNYQGSVNYRDLFPEPSGGIENCEAGGILGVLPGMIGTMQATEAIKIIAGIGVPLVNKVSIYNLYNNQSYDIDIYHSEESNSSLPKDEKEFIERNYEWDCSPVRDEVTEIDADQFNEYINNKRTLIIDVREKNESPAITGFDHLQIPLGELNNLDLIKYDKEIVFFCQTGKRSAEAVRRYRSSSTKKMLSLQGGIIGWKSRQQYKNIFVQGAITPSFISDSIQKHSSRTEIGGHGIFLGQVRADEIDGKTVEAIEYTSYESMALEKMHSIREAIFAKYPITCMHVYHSLGKVSVGEICLFVYTSGAHRKEAIDACEETVERLKAELPVWGRELFADNSHQWKVNK